ncbi:MAG: hypothetical protein KA072_00905 [Thermoanaerobaculaceae bacterium]|nr:hypothetical protein [Thermoanaerobaculaceae bacterium]MDI9621478.1 DUF5719 family protein [Acidobacteriota bacterium]
MKRTVALVTCMLLAGGVALALEPGKDLYVPSVGHGLGQSVNGVRAQWRADLWIFNPGAQAATVDIFLLLRNQANTAPDSRRVTVNPNEVRYFPDIVFTQFAKDSTYGALRVVSDRPVFVTGSSYDANVTVESKQRGAGTAGQFFSGVPAAQAVGVGETVDIVGLDQDGQGTDGTWRSNLAFVETDGQSASLNVERLDGAGQSLGMVPVSLRPREAKQLDLALLTINATPGSNQRVRVKVIAGPGHVIAAASHIDNRTGDPSTVEMAGMGSAGTYLCEVDKASYDTPIKLVVAEGTITSIEATILVTDEDVGSSCVGGELLRLAQTLSPAVALDSGTFSFTVGGTVAGVGVTMELVGSLDGYGGLAGEVTTTLTGAAGCSGTKKWPLVGARLR